MQKSAHITVDGVPFCTAWLGGSQAGMDLQMKVGDDLGIHPVNVCCGHPSVKDATQVAKGLRQRLKSRIAVVTGSCPDQEKA